MQLTNPEKVKASFDENGYVVIETGLSDALLDNVIATVSPYFGENREEPQGVRFSDSGRIQDAWLLNNCVSSVANSKLVLKTLKHLYGRKARPFQTLNFYKGTNQATHADSIHFNCEPFGLMCGVWVALEDIDPDQGPLRLYPKSHLLPEMNYEDFGLRPSQSEYSKYLARLDDVIRENSLVERRASIKKGQAVIWAANTLHGGAPQTNMQLTRYSQVTHYYMGRPKAWRPSFSEHGRAYFQPDSVRDIKGWSHRLHCYRARLRELTGLAPD